MWNGREQRARGRGTTTNHTKGWSSSKEGDVVYMWVGSESSTRSSFWSSINSNKYHPHVDQVKAALDKKCLELVNRKCIIFHQDNPRLHVSLMTKQKLLLLDWDVLFHLLYSPDIAPLDFHLFQSLQNVLNGKKGIPWKTVKDTWNDSFFF